MGSPSQQVAAVHSLLQQKAYSSVEVIAELLSSSDAAVRSTAAHALGFLGAQARDIAGHALMDLLADPELIVRAEVVDSLGLLQYTPARDKIESMLRNDPEPLVRASAAETLGDFGDPLALKALDSAIDDADESVRAYAANSLGLLGTSQLLPTIEKYLEKESSARVRAELLGAKYRLGAVEELGRLLDIVATVDEPPASAILNLLSDLSERKSPPTLDTDGPLIAKVITELAQRLPDLHLHVEEIKANLDALKRG